MNQYLIRSNDFSIKSEENICFIDFSAPFSKNAISLEMASLMKEVSSYLNNSSVTKLENFLSQQNSVIIVVRSLIENIFSSGGHLRDLITGEDSLKENYGESVRNFCKLISSLSTPSLTILSGKAYGGGLEIALASDFRWSIGKEIGFHFVQAGLGVPGGWGGMLRLAKLCPSLSAKKISTLFIAQDILDLESLNRLSLIDKMFMDEKSCYLELFRWRDNILACNEQLKNDYFIRNKVEIEKLEEFDSTFFQKYFLSENHKRNISNFLTNKRKQ